MTAIFKTDPTSNEPSPKPGGAARPSRCVSVPFATVPTYTERHHLSEELSTKLEKPPSEIRPTHAVVVTGLGGTGKTQLVLRYIEEHEEDFDTVLWIDVRSEEAARSAYERCCRALGLAVKAPASDRPLQDVPAVQDVLSWLRCRGEDKRWLAVVDNADDLSWGVSDIVPKGKAGAVIVTSQDAQASRLLGGHTPTVKVDAMEKEEAFRLMLKYFDEPIAEGDGCLDMIEEIIINLDRLALGIDLAGSRIRADVDQGDHLADALQQYLSDYQRHQDKLLRDEEFACMSTYKKTVWTAWETSLSSLRKVEKSQRNIYPIQLLRFVTLLNRANVQEELFRLASLGLKESCNQLDVSVPVWMQSLLGKGEDEHWNDFSYRETVKSLLRYGLVRPVGEPWKGITMHNLVGWRASVGMDREEFWRLYLVFIAAVSLQITTEPRHVSFRRHVVAHFPPNNMLLDEQRCGGIEQMCWMWATVGTIFYQEGRWKEAEELQVKVVETMVRLPGGKHSGMLTAIADLGTTYRERGRLEDAEELERQVMEARSEMLGPTHLDTLTVMADLAITLRRQMRLEEAETLETRVMAIRSEVLGCDHPDTLDIMDNLASTYVRLYRYKEAEKLVETVIKERVRLLGEMDPKTIDAKASLGVIYSRQQRHDEAEPLKRAVFDARKSLLGDEHPETLKALTNLGVTLSAQGSHEEAERLRIHVVKVRERLLGDDHPSTLTAKANLAWTFLDQGRRKEAKELFHSVTEARRRVLVEEQPDTIEVTAYLAATYRDRARLEEAEGLEVIRR